jgi:CDP-paratose 2-epimerase
MSCPPDTAPRRVLVTGGAGFVGANLCVSLARRHPAWEIVALDNLKRRGSELNLSRLREVGVAFVHGDVREPSDLLEVDAVDAIVECSAEPSALAGADGRTAYPVATNLVGAYNCLEHARHTGAQMIFLSTSRVYGIDALRAVRYDEEETRFRLLDDQPVPGSSARGISEGFPLDGPRTLYGATKLGAELLVTEYAHAFGLDTVIDRCGVIAGPWQMGRVDQGVFTHWLLAHAARRPLRYLGFGGSGKQVRDLLHVDDLVDLVDDQLQRRRHWAGTTLNVGGGLECSLSLRETTDLCAELTGVRVPIDAGEDRPGDIPVYVSDCRTLAQLSDWRPRRSPRQILSETNDWLADHGDAVRLALSA